MRWNAKKAGCANPGSRNSTKCGFDSAAASSTLTIRLVGTINERVVGVGFAIVGLSILAWMNPLSCVNVGSKKTTKA